ncbi:stomatin-like protein 2, mitochondrial [Frankliniella occidentalis]|uniref:Stomatin-like protein 2, mitochondrial n=1 Tax=Frankliniella occidentalis TaxID=133901 RepID=A0A6J1T6D5_FRAOC|nr:stomatin-like protein 2, mitochondrial [Frankliniella occidentalis]
MLSRVVTRTRTVNALKSGCPDLERLGVARNRLILHQPSRAASSTPFNTVIMFVPQQEAWIVERMGKFSRILKPGLNVLIPIVDKVKYVQSLKEITIDIPKQSAITKDNVNLSIDGVLYLKIMDPYKTSYGIEDPEFAVSQLAQTTMRAELGKMSLEQIFQERESLNVTIVEAINKASEPWGISCLRYEIRDIALPSRITEAMQMQVEAERKKRAAILESEGQREAEINVAEGRKRARILASEADKLEQVNRALGEAEALLAIAKARATGLNSVADSLGKSHGKNAASFVVAEQYVTAFEKLARTNNTLILPSNAGDISNAVGQAMSIYSTITRNQSKTAGERTSQLPFKGSDLEEYFSDPDETEKCDPNSPSSSSR